MHQTQPFKSWQHENGKVERQACESWCQMLGFPPKLTGCLPVALWDPQFLCSYLLSLLLCVSYCKGFDSGTPRFITERPTCRSVPPKWICSISPLLAMIFIFNSAETNGIPWLSCPHRKTMCFLPNSLKKTNFRIPWESRLPPAMIHIFGTSEPEGTAAMFVLLALFSSPQKEYLPSPWLQRNDHPSGNKDQQIPESYLNQIHGKSTLECPAITWGVE